MGRLQCTLKLILVEERENKQLGWVCLNWDEETKKVVSDWGMISKGMQTIEDVKKLVHWWQSRRIKKKIHIYLYIYIYVVFYLPAFATECMSPTWSLDSTASTQLWKVQEENKPGVWKHTHRLLREHMQNNESELFHVRKSNIGQGRELLYFVAGWQSVWSMVNVKLLDSIFNLSCLNEGFYVHFQHWNGGHLFFKGDDFSEVCCGSVRSQLAAKIEI